MDQLLARRTVSGTNCAKSPVVVVGQLTVQLSSLLGAVSCLETSFIFETCLRNLGKINSSLFLVVRKARGVARAKTWKLLIRNRGSSLHYCQVVGFESSPLDKRELWNGVSIEDVSE